MATTEPVDLLALLAEVEAEMAAGIVPAEVAEYNARKAADQARFAASKNALTAVKCSRCFGRGTLDLYRHVAGGCCFDCLGSGVASYGV